MVMARFSLHAANLEYGTVGIRLAQTLGIGAQWDGFLKIYAPQKEGQLDMTESGCTASWLTR